jgi:hypothetical protein
MTEMTSSPQPTSENETRCARHPQVATELRCGRCDTPICPRCLVQTPVGARCPTCANVRRIPTVDVKPIFLVRGLGAALVAGVAVGAFWGYATGGRGFFGFLMIFVAMGIGWAVSEAVSLATNRKRGTALQACSIIGVVLSYFVHNLVAGDPLLPAGDIWGYVATAFAATFAASRLRF